MKIFNRQLEIRFREQEESWDSSTGLGVSLTLKVVEAPMAMNDIAHKSL